MNENYVTLGQVCDKGSSNIAQKDLAEREGQYPIYGAAGLIKNVDFAHQKQPYIAVVKDGAGIGRVMKLPAYSSVIGTMQYIFPKENVDIDYLFYALQHMNLGKYFSGSTIPHIYFRDYQKERLKLPVMEVQQRQADTLSRIDAISAYGQRQIALMDEIVKSRFVEMFGAIQEMVPLSYYIRGLSAGKSLAGEDECVNKVLKTGATTYDYFDSAQVKNLPLDYIPQEEHRVKTGDVIISRMNTAELVGAAAYVWEAPDHTYLPDRLWKAEVRDTACPIFVWQLLIQKDTKESIRRIASGTSGSMKNISKPGLLGIRVIKAEVATQNRFAAFVAEVDKSKLAVKQSLEKLETLKKSLMQQYFGV